MKTKHDWTITIFVIVVGALLLSTVAVPGCEYGRRINQAREAFIAENPTAATIPVDEDGDGITDFLGVDADGDHQVDIDSTGKPVEVPGSREEFNRAGAVDTSIAELIALAGLAFGVPGATGLLGRWWGRRKPIKQLTGLVVSLEQAKQKGAPEGAMLIGKTALELYLREQLGLVETLDKMRAKAKFERKEAEAIAK